MTLWISTIIGIAAAVMNANAIDLSREGTILFRVGDDSSWSQPDFDDSDWQKVTIPGTWSSYGVGPRNVFGWYRIRFRIREPLDERVGLHIGELGTCAEETFLNGTRIGGMGKIGKKGYDANAQSRVYRIPSELLHTSGENIIAIRICRLVDTAGIRSGTLEIGNYASLLEAENSKRSWLLRAEIVAFTLLLGSTFFITICLLYRGWNTELAALLGLFTAATVSFFCYSYLVEEWGIKNHALYFQLGSVSTLGFFWFYLLYLKAVLQFRWNPGIVISISGLSLITILLAIYPTPINHYLKGNVSLIWVFYVVFGMGLAVTTSFPIFRLQKKSDPGIGWIHMGIAILVFGFIFYLLELPRQLGWNFANSSLVPYILTLAFCSCLLGASAVRFLSALDRVSQLSQKVIDAQVEEQRRVARDLHDGVSQSLQGIRLRTQILHRQATPETKPDLEELTDALQETLEEVRGIAHELRPEYLDELTLSEAITWHSRNYEPETTITVRSVGEDENVISPLVAENLFRIFQECLSNAVKHGGATEFIAEFQIDRQGVDARFEDNGSGFNPDEATSSGIGLSTMRERAESLGGTIAIRSQPRKRTLVEVTIPMERSILP